MPNAPAGSILLNTDNATPTPTTRDALPIVKAQLGILPQDTSYDLKLALLAESAMEKYNELAPVIKRTTITTIPGQIAYPLPGDCWRVFDVQVPSQYGYYNDFLFLPMIDTPASTLFGYSDYAFRSPSERFVRQGILGELDHYANSFAGYYVDGTPPQLYILPTVTSALNSIVRYGAQHQNVSSDPLNPSWTDLPTGHWRQVIRLIKWALADSRADQIVGTAALSEAGGGNALLTESWKLSNRADRILQEVRSALGQDVPVAIRS